MAATMGTPNSHHAHVPLVPELLVEPATGVVVAGFGGVGVVEVATAVRVVVDGASDRVRDGAGTGRVVAVGDASAGGVVGVGIAGAEVGAGGPDVAGLRVGDWGSSGERVWSGVAVRVATADREVETAGGLGAPWPLHEDSNMQAMARLNSGRTGVDLVLDRAVGIDR